MTRLALVAAHQSSIGFSLGAVTADQARWRPSVQMSPGLVMVGCASSAPTSKIIIFDAVLKGVLKQSIDLGRLKTSKGHIEVSTLQICNEQSQLILIPITADFIEGNVEGFFFSLIHCHHKRSPLRSCPVSISTFRRPTTRPVV